MSSCCSRSCDDLRLLFMWMSFPAGRARHLWHLEFNMVETCRTAVQRGQSSQSQETKPQTKAKTKAKTKRRLRLLTVGARAHSFPPQQRPRQSQA